MRICAGHKPLLWMRPPRTPTQDLRTVFGQHGSGLLTFHSSPVPFSTSLQKFNAWTKAKTHAKKQVERLRKSGKVPKVILRKGCAKGNKTRNRNESGHGSGMGGGGGLGG